MQLVVDPSAILAVLLHEPERNSLIAGTKQAVLMAPGSMPWEVGNALIAGFRRRRLSIEEVQSAWTSFEAIPMRFVDVDVSAALDIAAEHGLYAYDGYVLATAMGRGIPMLTLDKALIRAAKKVGVDVLEV